MSTRTESLTVTLHWRADGREQAGTIVCEDTTPTRLLPMLLEGCGLRAADAAGQPRPFALRLHSAQGQPLRHDERLSAQGARSGGHLWLSEGGVMARRRCLLSLPDGSEATLPPRGVTLTRVWLLQLMALLNPAGHTHELELLERRESPYAYVSKGAHCSLEPGRAGGLVVVTTRADIATLLNGARLFPETPEALADGDRLTLGAYGPTLTISFVEA